MALPVGTGSDEDEDNTTDEGVATAERSLQRGRVSDKVGGACAGCMGAGEPHGRSGLADRARPGLACCLVSALRRDYARCC